MKHFYNSRFFTIGGWFTWVAVGVAAVSVAGSAYAAHKSSEANKQASQALSQQQPLELNKLPPPAFVDTKGIGQTAIGQNYNNLPMDFALANKVNLFNTGQAIRDYTKVQPYFTGIQSQIGKNALSYAKGELPSDVVSSIGRAAAQRGIEGGFAGGLNAGGPGSALGSLNLRNLGLSSLQLSQQGTAIGMDVNRSAAALAPNLFDVSSQFISPNQVLQGNIANTGIINDWNRYNTDIQNQQAGANTQQANQIQYDQTQLALQSQLAQAQAVQSASSSVAGILGAGTGGGTGGMLGRNGSGFYGSSLGASLNTGNGGTVSSSPYGYAIRPSIVG